MFEQGITVQEILYRIGVHHAFGYDEPVTDKEQAFQFAYDTAKELNEGRTYFTTPLLKTNPSPKTGTAHPPVQSAKRQAPVLAAPKTIALHGILIDLISSDTVHRHIDFNIPCMAGNLLIERNYISRDKDKIGLFGKGFLSNIEITCLQNGPDIYQILWQDGSEQQIVAKEPPAPGIPPVVTVNEAKKEVVYRRKTRFYIFHTDGKLKKIKDAYGNLIEIRYHNGGRMVDKVVTSCGITLGFIYENNKVAAIYDCAGRKVLYHYQDDALVEVVLQNGGKFRYTYDNKLGRLIQIMDPLGQGQNKPVFKIDTDRYGKIIAYSRYAKTYRFSYQPHERETAITELALGDEQTKYRFCYDGANRVTRYLINQDETTAEYDSMGHLVANGLCKKHYNADGQLVAYESGKDKRTLSYNPLGQVNKITNAKGQVFLLGYNQFGKVVEVKETYDVGKSAITTYEYDAHGRCIKKKMPPKQAECYGYHTGNSVFPEEVGYPNGFIIKRHYDAINRMIACTQAGRKTTYHYNNINRLIETVFPGGSRDFKKYNIGGQLTEVIAPLENHLSKVDKRPVKGFVYTYDEDGAVALIQTPEANRINPGSVAPVNQKQREACCVYNFRGQLTVLRTKMEHNEAVDAYSYEEFDYDQSGRITAIKTGMEACSLVSRPSLFKITNLSYDDRDNLVALACNDGYKEHRFYIEKDKLDTRKIAVNDTNTVTLKYKYNEQGTLAKMIALMAPGDGDMNAAADKERSSIRIETSFKYDANGDLTKIILPDGTALALCYNRDAEALREPANAFLKMRCRNTLISDEERIMPPGKDINTDEDWDIRNGPTGKITQIISKDGSYQFMYNAQGKLVKITHPNGLFERIAYDKAANIAEHVDTGGKKTTYMYNSINRLKKVEYETYQVLFYYGVDGLLSTIVVN